MAKRVKRMPEEQFLKITERDWNPVGLVGDAVPSWLRGIPADKLNSIYASGGKFEGLPHGDERIPSKEIIGGIDVYRNAPDDSVELNKDWYAVIVDQDNEGMLLIVGPIRDDEHWIDEIPKRLEGAKVVGVPRKPVESGEEQ